MKFHYAGIFAVAAVLTAAQSIANDNFAITEAEVDAAQTAWAEGIVTIGQSKSEGGDYVEAARQHIHTLYAYGEGAVLFKPTKAAEDQFRGSEEEALSYFVKGVVSEDKGFAINPWVKVRFDNENIVIDSDSALAMGNYYFTDPTGTEVKVEYSFGYVRGTNGDLLVNMHHSSLPYSADAK